MKQLYYVTTDSKGYVTNIVHTGTTKDFCELDLDEYDLSNDRKGAYKLGKNKLIFDPEKYAEMQKEKQDIVDKKEIDELKQKLADTDWIMIKMAEDMIPCTTFLQIRVVLATTYIQHRTTINNRKIWRKRIEDLEGV